MKILQRFITNRIARFYFLVFLCAYVLCSYAVLSCYAVEQNIAESFGLYSKGAEYYHKGKFYEAKEVLERAVRLDPTNDEAQVYLTLVKEELKIRKESELDYYQDENELEIELDTEGKNVQSQKEKKPKEILITPQRAGFERYYIPGEGFKLTKSLGIGAKFEMFEDPRSVEDCISWVVGETPWEFSKSEIRHKLTPSFTRVYGSELIFQHEDYPRFKYIYESREEPREEFPSSTDIHEFNLLETFSFFEHENLLTLNPIYKKSYYKNSNPWWGPEQRNEYLLNYTLKITDSLEIFGQIDYQRAKKSKTPGLDRLGEKYYRIEFRNTFPEHKLRFTPGYRYQVVDERPSNKSTTRHEIYFDIGKDFTRKLSGSTRLEYNLSDKSEEARVDAIVFNCNNKLSYNIYKDFYISGYLNYSRDLSDVGYYDMLNLIAEIEYFKWGFLRWNLGYRHTEYTEIDVGFDTAYFKIYFFI